MSFLHALFESFSIADNPGFYHLTEQVITLTGTLSHSGKYRKTIMFLGYIVNQLLDKHRFAYTGATE